MSIAPSLASRRLRRLLPPLLCVAAPLAWLARPSATAQEEDVGKQIQAIVDGQAKVPRDRIDPATIVASSGGDPAKLQAWVRENTRLVAYPGTLRGALGVLMDRSGNSLDRSLLLAHLVALAGFEARIVSADLTEPAAAALWLEARAPMPSGPAAPGPDTLGAEADAITASLLTKTGPLARPANAAADLRHAWVQYQDGKNWIDLDVTLAEAGKRRAEPDGDPIVIDLAKKDTKGLAKLAHTVTLRLSVERWEDGKLLESPLLVVPFDSKASPLAAATLTCVPVNVKASRAMQREFTSGAQLREKLLSENAWSPVLVDGKSGGRMARMFDAAGNVGDLPKAFSGAEEVGNAARNVFGGLAGMSEDKAEAKSVLTALAADYVIQKPGQPARRVRRYVFDSIGPQTRLRAKSEAVARPAWSEQERLDRGADLAALHDTLVTFASLPFEVYVYRFAQRVIDSKAAALRAARGPADPRTFELVANGLSLKTLELYAVARGEHTPSSLVVTEPQIFRRIVRAIPNANKKDIDLQVVSDLAWNRLAPADSSASLQQLVRQGVLDTLREAITVFRTEPPRAGDTTAALFAEAARQGIETVAIRDAKDPTLESFPGAARARILGDIAAGNLVVVPAKPVPIDKVARLGWWRIDSASGHTVGVMDTGLLQEFVEYTETESVNGITITRFYRVRVPPGAREWAERAIARRSSTSWSQWENLLRYATRNFMNLRGPMI